MRARWLLFSSLLSAIFVLSTVGGCGCGEPPSDNGGEQSCTKDDECGDGEKCVDGKCEAEDTTDPDGGTPPDGDGGVDPTDGGPAPDAGPVEGPTDPIRDPDEDDPNNANLDSDCDGLSDEEEFTQVYAGGEKTDPADYDSDDDGIADGVEAGRDTEIDPECTTYWIDYDTSTTTNPTVADTDADCIPDGLEDLNKSGSVDPGETDPASPDSDGDGISDTNEDANCNGVVDPGETSASNADTDGDGINDLVETAVVGTDPLNADTDGDGIPDGNEDRNQNGTVDPGETDPLVADQDTDGDGISDATETNFGYDPTDPDMDDDGICDGPLDVAGVCVGGEDANGNGVRDQGETDPNNGDSDCDAIDDGDEATYGTDPNRSDTDGDLVPDGVEVGKTTVGACATADVDTDGSTTTDPLQTDTDGDGINDGIEDRNQNGAYETDLINGGYETEPDDADMDGDGLCDGPSSVMGVCVAGEDFNRNGQVDAGETNPRVANVDTDGDGIEDGEEDTNGNGMYDANDTDGSGRYTETDPNNADTDGDGLNDGEEINTTLTDPRNPDSDCDGIPDGDEINWCTTQTCDCTPGPSNECVSTLDPLNPDSDGDGILDGVEAGYDSFDGGNSAASAEWTALCGATFVADADTASTTDPANPDTDGDGIVDGAEDANQNGAFDNGEILNPNDAGDTNPTRLAACAEPIEPMEYQQASSDTFFAADPGFSNPNTAPPSARSENITSGGNVVGQTTYDESRKILAFAVNRTPEDATPSNQLLNFLEPRIAFNANNGLRVPLRQTFTTWDGYPAVRATYEYDNAAGHGLDVRLRRVIREVLGDSAADVPLTGAPTDTGTFRLGLEVIRRSDTALIVSGSLATLSDVNANEAVAFGVDDVINGSAIGQVGDQLGQQCDLFQSQEDVKVDFIWVVDDSGSMGDAQDALSAAVNAMTTNLANAAMDWRIGMVTTAYYFTGASADRCDFTRDSGAFTTCINDVDDMSTGDERHFESLKRILTGEYFDGANTQTDTYHWLPGTAAGAMEDPTKIRNDARVVVIFLTDAGDQSDSADAVPLTVDVGNKPVANDLSGWTAWAQGGSAAVSWDPNRTDEEPLILGGILCPLGITDGFGDPIGCTGESDSTASNSGNYSLPFMYDSIGNLGGVTGAISQPDGANSAPDAEIEATILGILDSVSGQAAPYDLTKPPVSSTIKVALEGPTQGDCAGNAGTGPVADVPRSRLNGFAFDGATQTIAFFGNCRPSQVNTEVAVSYKYWTDLTGDPDGGDQPCGGCEDPFVCVNDQCLCPADCGTGAPLPADYTCDVTTCSPVCLPDCGGQCGSGQECLGVDGDGDGSCDCACPADCNGTPPPSGSSVCDLSTCEWICPQNGCDPAEKPTANDNWVCGADCNWTCPSDCGGNLGPFEICDQAVCEPQCSPDCNASCTGYEQCDADSCSCQCVESATCAAGFVFDSNACDCVCDAAALGCPATHTPDLDACTCTCGESGGAGTGVDCNNACEGILEGSVCNTGTCGCACPAGFIPADGRCIPEGG
jgi:hypothetical protein